MQHLPLFQKILMSVKNPKAKLLSDIVEKLPSSVQKMILKASEWFDNQQCRPELAGTEKIWVKKINDITMDFIKSQAYFSRLTTPASLGTKNALNS